MDPALLVPVEEPALPTEPVKWPVCLVLVKQQQKALEACNARFPAIEEYQERLQEEKTSD